VTVHDTEIATGFAKQVGLIVPTAFFGDLAEGILDGGVQVPALAG
jgi:hypothetical protein